MNFEDTQTYAVHDLDGLKKFCHRGLDLKIVEEKVKTQKIKDRKEVHLYSFHWIQDIMIQMKDSPS